MLSTIRSLCQSLVGYVILHVFSDGMISLHYLARRSSSVIHSILALSSLLKNIAFTIGVFARVNLSMIHVEWQLVSSIGPFPSILWSTFSLRRQICKDVVEHSESNVEMQISLPLLCTFLLNLTVSKNNNPARPYGIGFVSCFPHYLHALSPSCCWMLMEKLAYNIVPWVQVRLSSLMMVQSVGVMQLWKHTMAVCYIHACLIITCLQSTPTTMLARLGMDGPVKDCRRELIIFVCHSLCVLRFSHVVFCNMLGMLCKTWRALVGVITGHCKSCLSTNYVLIIRPDPRYGIETYWWQNLAGGSCKESFIGAVEACCTDPRYCWDSTVLCPNTMWGQLQQIVHDCATAAFPCDDRLSNRAPVDTMEALQQRRDDRLALVQMPRHSMLPFGTCCAGPGSICLQAVSEIFQQWRLAANFRKSDRFVRRLSQRDRRRWLAKHFSIFQDAWQTRQLHDVWKAGRVLSGFRMGPKKRRYDVPSHCRPSAQQWVDFLACPGSEEGCSGTLIHWQEPRECLPTKSPTLQEVQLAQQDALRLERHIRKSHLRKSVPPWSCPVEVWRMLFQSDTHHCRHGLGYEPRITVCHMFRRRIFQVCLCIRIRSRSPQIWNRGLAAQLDKPNHKPGCAGKRLVNQLDPVGAQYYKQLWAMATPRSFRQYAAGYYAGKSRISAIMQRHVLSCRLDACGYRHVESFFDVSNAFPSPTHSALDAAVQAVARPVDVDLLCQRHRQAVMHIVAHDNAVDILSGSGAMQGDGPAGPLFLEVYHPQIDGWLAQVQTLPQQQLCIAQDPVSGSHVDCSITAYADDVGKTTIVEDESDLLQKMLRINSWMDEALEGIGLAQNCDKQEHVVHATGRGSRNFLRAMYTRGVGAGKTLPTARYLGGRRSYDNSCHHEISHRVRAAYGGYNSMGSFWSRASGCRRATLLVFRCMVHEALLSGLEALFLSASDVRKLDKVVMQLGRKIMRGGACLKQRVAQPDGSEVVKYTAKPNAFVWRFLRIAPSEIELRIKRLVFWQQVARAPSKHAALLATMFAQFPFEDSPTLYPDGRPASDSHAWVTLLCNDIEALREVDVVAHIAEQMDGKPVRLFHDPLCEQFALIDCSILRKAFLSVAIPPPGYVDVPAEVEPPNDGIDDPTHVCHDTLPDGSICGARFSSFRALQSHRRKAAGHSFIAPECRLAITNQCPWCKCVFSTIAHARRHIKKSLSMHRCCGDGSVVPVPLLPVGSLACGKCGHACQSVSDLQQHVVNHFGGIDFSAEWN